MLEFQPVQLEDQEHIDRDLTHATTKNYDECFATLYSWKDTYHAAYARTQGCLLLRLEEEGRPGFIPPVGAGDFTAAMRELMRSQKEKGEPLVMISVTDESRARLEGAFPGQFVFEHRRDLDDYIHLTASLGELKGKDFHGKRGHVKKFSMLYNYEYRPMPPELVPAVLEMNTAWCRGHSYDDDDAARHEKLAAELLLRNFEALHVEGGVLLVDGRVVAASAGTPQFSGSDTIVVHFEKGLTEYEGIYSAICHFFMKDCSSRYTYANREEDMGIPGLRKSKLSYYPELILTKYEAVWQG